MSNVDLIGLFVQVVPVLGGAFAEGQQRGANLGDRVRQLRAVTRMPRCAGPSSTAFQICERLLQPPRPQQHSGTASDSDLSDELQRTAAYVDRDVVGRAGAVPLPVSASAALGSRSWSNPVSMCS